MELITIQVQLKKMRKIAFRIIISCSIIQFQNAVNAQNIGLSTLTPQGKVHIVGTEDIPQLIIDANSIQSNVSPLIKIRKSNGTDLIWLSSDDSTNCFLGLKAGRVNSILQQAVNNTFIGSRAGYANTNGNHNTSIGANALSSNTKASLNTAIGAKALFTQSFAAGSVSWESRNVAVGYEALYLNQPTSIGNGHNNTAVVRECANAQEGIEAIKEEKPDVVFLDVEMPRMNGFGMLQQLEQRNFELIFTTAYDHYAIQAIRYSALDYLVKPIEINTLMDAVEKARERRQIEIPNQRIEALLYNLVNERNQKSRIVIPSHEGLQFVELDDIIYLEAESNYTSIYLREGNRIFVSKTLKDFEELLPHIHFLRIHHSYLINKDHMHKYLKGDGGQVLMSNGKTLDVARRKKDEFMKAIGY